MKPQNIKCPECGGEMISRRNRNDGARFWGCKKFPDCRGTRDVNGLSKADRDTERNREVHRTSDEDEREDEPNWKRRYD